VVLVLPVPPPGLLVPPVLVDAPPLELPFPEEEVEPPVVLGVAPEPPPPPGGVR
jgi:hypothetical protein